MDRMKEAIKAFEDDVAYTKQMNWSHVRIHMATAELILQRIRELERLLCIAHDYLKEHWEMEAAPLHEIDEAVRKLLENTRKGEGT